MALSSFVRRVSGSMFVNPNRPYFLSSRLSVETPDMSFTSFVRRISSSILPLPTMVSPKAFNRAISTSRDFDLKSDEVCLWIQNILGNLVDVRKRIPHDDDTQPCELEQQQDSDRFVLFLNPKSDLIQNLSNAFLRDPNQSQARKHILNMYTAASYYHGGPEIENPYRNSLQQSICDKLFRDHKGTWDPSKVKKQAIQPSQVQLCEGSESLKTQQIQHVPKKKKKKHAPIKPFVRPSSDWKVPKPRTLKGNSDGSHRDITHSKYPSHGTSSSLLRDYRGDVKISCCRHLHEGHGSLHTEAVGMFDTIMLSFLHNNSSLALETDCLPLIEFLVRDTKALKGSSYESIIHRLRLVFRLKWEKLDLLLADRKDNAVADMLATEAYGKPVGFYLDKPLPTCVVNQVEFEKWKNIL